MRQFDTKNRQFNTPLSSTQITSIPNSSQFLCWTDECFELTSVLNWRFLVLNWRVCLTEAFYVLNWRFLVLNCGVLCVELTHFSWSDAFLCWTDKFLGLKSSAPFVLNWCVEMTSVLNWGGPGNNERLGRANYFRWNFFIEIFFWSWNSGSKRFRSGIIIVSVWSVF